MAAGLCRERRRLQADLSRRASAGDLGGRAAEGRSRLSGRRYRCLEHDNHAGQAGSVPGLSAPSAARGSANGIETDRSLRGRVATQTLSGHPHPPWARLSALNGAYGGKFAPSRPFKSKTSASFSAQRRSSRGLRPDQPIDYLGLPGRPHRRAHTALAERIRPTDGRRFIKRLWGSLKHGDACPKGYADSLGRHRAASTDPRRVGRSRSMGGVALPCHPSSNTRVTCRGGLAA